MDLENRNLVESLEVLELSSAEARVQMEVEWFRALHDITVPNEKWHFHTNLEIHFVTEGKVRFYFQDEDCEPGKYMDVEAGQIILIPADVLHRLENPFHTPYFRFALNLRLTPINETPEALFLCQTLRPMQPKCATMSGMTVALLKRCLDESSNQTSGFISVIQCSLELILWEVAREISNNPHAAYPVAKRTDYMAQRAAQIYQFVQSSIHVNPSCEDIAEYMHLSTKQIQRVVRQMFGMAVKEFVMNVRLKCAKTLLKDPSLNLASIAVSVGLVNEQSFCRYFHRMEGQTPHQYRIGAIPPQKAESRTVE